MFVTPIELVLHAVRQPTKRVAVRPIVKILVVRFFIFIISFSGFDLVYALNTDRLSKMLQFLQINLHLPYNPPEEMLLKTPEALCSGGLHWGFILELLFLLALLNVRKCCEVFFTCSYLDYAVNVVDEDLAVADMAGVQSLLSCCDYLIYRDRGYDNFDLDLR